MKYKDFEGSVEELIRLELKEVEKSENVKILHAIESGSRAWGFASPDSDYDVRFIYLRPKEYYLKLEETKDIIDWELDDTLDINGWDINKVLRLFHKSNSTLFEWANSPIIYQTTDEWKKIYEIAKEYFSVKSGMYSYYGTAKSNFYEYLQDDYVKYKKYFYVIRPILACKWIEERKCPPPVLFSKLVENTLEEHMKPIIKELLEVKVTMKESDKGKKLVELNNYIENKLDYYKDYIASQEDDREPSWDRLNKLFLSSML